MQDTKILVEHALSVQFTYQSINKPETSTNRTQHAINVEASSSRSIEKYLSFQLCKVLHKHNRMKQPNIFHDTMTYLVLTVVFKRNLSRFFTKPGDVFGKAVKSDLNSRCIRALHTFQYLPTRCVKFDISLSPFVL